MIAGQGQAQRLNGDPPRTDGRVARAAGADLQIGLPPVEGGRMQLAADLGQPETGARLDGPEGPDEVGHQPGAQRLLNGQGRGPGLGLDGWLTAAIPSSSWCSSASIRVGIHDFSSLISYIPVIGRMVRDQADWRVTDRSGREDRQMENTTYELGPLLAEIRDGFRGMRAIRACLRATSRPPRAARNSLERDLASYTSPADLNELDAILDRYTDQETADIGRIIAARSAP